MVDVTDETKVSIWAEKVTGTPGVPDVLICNAALINTPVPSPIALTSKPELPSVLSST